MSALGIDIDLRPDYLEDHWDDEAKCQSAHSKGECSISVVARKIVDCQGRDFLICQNSFNINFISIQVGHICKGCGRTKKECWELIPV